MRRATLLLVLSASLGVPRPAEAQERLMGELRVGGGYDSNPALAAGAGDRRLPQGRPHMTPVQGEDGVVRLAGMLAGRLGGSPGLMARLDLDGHVFGSGAFLFWERLTIEGSLRVDDVTPRCRAEGGRLDISLTDDSAWSLGLTCGASFRLPESFWVSADARGGMRAFDTRQLDGLVGGELAIGWDSEHLALELGVSVIRRQSNLATASRTDLAPWVALRASSELVGGQLAYSLVGRVFDDEARSGWEHVGRLSGWVMPLPWIGAYAELELGQAEGGPQALGYGRAQIAGGVRLVLDWRPPLADAEPRQGPAVVEEDGWVEFRFAMPEARSVSVVGDFNDWDAQRGRLGRRGDGTFAGRMRLGPGRHEYHLMVDGQPQPPPGADRYVSDDFGGQNAVVVIEDP